MKERMKERKKERKKGRNVWQVVFTTLCDTYVMNIMSGRYIAPAEEK